MPPSLRRLIWCRQKNPAANPTISIANARPQQPNEVDAGAVPPVDAAGTGAGGFSGSAAGFTAVTGVGLAGASGFWTSTAGRGFGAGLTAALGRSAGVLMAGAVSVSTGVCTETGGGAAGGDSVVWATTMAGSINKPKTNNVFIV